ncbi:MAG: phasin family protein [Yoonia sp.]|nr:phasin family protein [Yoonia sp.]
MAKSDKSANAANPMASMLEAMQSTKFPAMPDFGTSWMENVADYGQEVMNFMAKRVAEDVQTQHALLHAKGVAEVQHIQAQFFQRAMDDYADETARLMELGKSMTPNSTGDKDDTPSA